MKAIKSLFFLTVATSLLICSSCDKIEEATTIKVPVPDFTIDIPAIVTPTNLQASGLRSTLELNHFSGTATLDMTDSNFADLKKNLDFLTSISIGIVNVQVSSSTGTVVENLTLSSEVGSFTIAKYTFGGDYYSSAELAAYATDLFNKFIEKGQVTVSVSGDTDVEGGELTVGLFFGNIEIKAKVLKL